jgi:hypothetical protein
MRKRFLVLASVATMALTGAAAPAFADNGNAAAAAAPALVTVTCTIQPELVNPGTGQVVGSVTFRIAAQAATVLTANARTFINPLTRVKTTITCQIV